MLNPFLVWTIPRARRTDAPRPETLREIGVGLPFSPATLIPQAREAGDVSLDPPLPEGLCQACAAVQQ